MYSTRTLYGLHSALRRVLSAKKLMCIDGNSTLMVMEESYTAYSAVRSKQYVEFLHGRMDSEDCGNQATWTIFNSYIFLSSATTRDAAID